MGIKELLQSLQYIPFNSLYFILFLTFWTAVYYTYAPKLRWMILLAASVVFYIFAGVEKLPFILATSVIIWSAAWRMDRIYREAETEAEEKQLSGKEKTAFFLQYKRKCRNTYLLPAIVVVVGILAYCKFFEKLAVGISGLLSLQSISIEVIVPLGISYYTFSSLGYLLDVYWRKTECEKNFFKFALCVFYFPQIVQGPIATYQKLLPQFTRENHFDYKRICFGIQLMLYGYFKKMVIADRLAIFTGQVLGNIEIYAGLIFPVTLVFASLQLYMDFSGCMDIARGVSQIFGIELDNNFDHPFFSKSTAEFWRRWHMTLGRWFKNYVYLPVATSRWMIDIINKTRQRFGKNAAKNVGTVVPVMFVWLLTGIWHGTGWNYVVWGLYYGIIISCDTIFSSKYKRLADRLHINTESESWQIFQMVRTFGIFTVGRLIIAPGTLTATWRIIRQTFSCFNPWILWDGTLYGMGLDYRNLCLAFLSLLLVRKFSMMQEKGSVREYIAKQNVVVRWIFYYGAIFAILIFGIYGPGYDASDFVYVQF